MRVFISHSASDEPLVQALRGVIRSAFHEEVHVSYSTAKVAEGGIAAGEDWLSWIHDQVRSSAATIIVLTPTSRSRPWLMWEAGAVSGAGLARGRSNAVVPLLFGIRRDHVPSPLRSKQTKLGTVERDIADLLESIRTLGCLTFQSSDCVQDAIAAYLASIKQARIPGMHDVFVSCPMTSIEADEYEGIRQAVHSLSNEIAALGSSVYSAMQRLGTQHPDPENIAAEKDFTALKSSRHFVMIYPRPVMSSCIAEAGYALGAGIQSTYFVRKDDDLPYSLRGAIESSPIVRRVRFRDPQEIVEHLLRYPDRILGDGR
jgi:hypothetical protein